MNFLLIINSVPSVETRNLTLKKKEGKERQDPEHAFKPGRRC